MLRNGKHSFKLGNRLFLLNEFGNTAIPPDADQWRQCHRWRSIYSRCGVKQEGKLLTLQKLLTTHSISERALSYQWEKRKFDRTRKRQHKKRVKQDLSNIMDEDLKRYFLAIHRSKANKSLFIT